MTNNPIGATLQFITYLEGLKRERRNSWLSNGERESVSDHSWRMVMMAMILAPKTSLDLNIERVLKMAAIHDLAEIETGDIPTIHQTQEVVNQKNKDELAAFTKMRSMLDNDSGEELYNLFHEFEDQQTVEAVFVRILDKFECVIQKNQQSKDVDPGAEGYFEKLEKLCSIDPYLSSFYAGLYEDVKKRNNK
jgi:putative hydrolases of HD superfamily